MQCLTIQKYQRKAEIQIKPPSSCMEKLLPKIKKRNAIYQFVSWAESTLFSLSAQTTPCIWGLASGIWTPLQKSLWIYINIIKKLESTLNRLQIVWNCSFQKQWENADSPLSLPTGRNERPSCCRHQQHFAFGVVSLASEHIAKRLVWIYNNSNEKLEYTPNRPKL